MYHGTSVFGQALKNHTNEEEVSKAKDIIFRDKLDEWLDKLKEKLETDILYQDRIETHITITGDKFIDFYSYTDVSGIGNENFLEFSCVPRYEFIDILKKNKHRTYERTIEKGKFNTCITKVRTFHVNKCLYIYMYDPSITSDPTVRKAVASCCIVC